MIELIPNQPIRFDLTDDECRCGGFVYNQCYNNNDIIPFQFKIDVCSGELEQISQNDFNGEIGDWTLGPGWQQQFDIDLGKQVMRHRGNSGQGDLTQDSLLVGQYYCTVIDVASLQSGELQIFLGTNLVGTIRSAGTFTFYGFCTGNDNFIVRAISGTECLLNTVSAKFLSLNHIVAIKDNSTGALVSLIKLGDFITPGSLRALPFTLAGNFVSVFIDFTDPTFNLPDGCYCICLLDACENTCGQNGVENGDFEIGRDLSDNDPTAPGWVFNSPFIGISPLGNYCTAETDAIGQIREARQEITLCANITYKVCITTVANGNPNEEIRVLLGTNVIGTIAPGSPLQKYTFTGQANGSDLVIGVERTQGAGSSNADFDNVILELNDPTDYQPNFCSQQLDIGTWECTEYLNVCPANDAFGFRFTDTFFSLAIRLRGERRNPRYPNDRRDYVSSGGTRNVSKFVRRKNKEFAIEIVPEYIHDFLSLLPGMNAIFFNLDPMAWITVDGEYDLDYEEGTKNITGIIIFVEEKSQDIKNILCDETFVDCSIIGSAGIETGGDESAGLLVTAGIGLQI